MASVAAILASEGTPLHTADLFENYEEDYVDHARSLEKKLARIDDAVQAGAARRRAAAPALRLT